MQRYYCTGCKRHFSAKTNRVLGLTKLSREKWIEYARCVVDGLTLRASQQRVGVSLRTSFFMRHRICECMGKYLNDFRVDIGCSAQIDEYHVRESFTGNHKHNQSFAMPRDPRKRGRDKVKSGISSDQVCILTGVNDQGDCFLELAGRGRLTKNSAREILVTKIAAGSIISTDKHLSYKLLMGELGVSLHNRYGSKDRRQGVINIVNSLHSRLEAFLRPFGSIATRRLANYLSWFKWLELFKQAGGHKEKQELMVKHIVNGSYDTKIREYRDTPYPFGEYWGLAC